MNGIKTDQIPLLLVLLILGVALGLTLRYYIHPPIKAYVICFHFYIIESLLLNKLRGIDRDFSLQFFIPPFLMMIYYLLPDEVDKKIYVDSAWYSIGGLLVLFILSVLFVADDQYLVTQTSLPSMYFVLPSTILFVYTNQTASDFYIECALVFVYASLYLFSNMIEQILWQTDVTSMVVIELVLWIYICLCLAVRLFSICEEEPLLFLLHLFLISLATNYLDWMCYFNAVGGCVMLLALVIMK